jgi:hypothetical protein
MCTYEERKITREKFCLSWKFALLRPERIQRSANILYTSKAETGVGGGKLKIYILCSLPTQEEVFFPPQNVFSPKEKQNGFE